MTVEGSSIKQCTKRKPLFDRFSLPAAKSKISMVGEKVFLSLIFQQTESSIFLPIIMKLFVARYFRHLEFSFSTKANKDLTKIRLKSQLLDVILHVIVN